MARQTRAIINLSALEDNYEAMCAHAPNSKQVVVVKANAYGNGAVEVAKKLDAKASMFAVAFLDEVFELREAGIESPILVLQGPHEEHECELTKHLNVVWMLHLEQQLNWVNKRIENGELTDDRHWVKFDTGMHRLGLPCAEYDELAKAYPHIFSANTVITTHLARADEPEIDDALTRTQSFLTLMANRHQHFSIANSAGNIALPSAALDYNRMGISLYGSSPFENKQIVPNLKTVMTLESQVIAIREIDEGEAVGYGATWVAKRASRIATVALGYADGYPRHAPSGTPAYFDGHIAKLVGRVSMDMLTFDVTDLDTVEVGTRVELWGEKLNINDVAKFVGTIAYELMTRVSARVPRVYR
ncbi:alanine racemase [Glaciecola sp. MH2013]|uniref:alanine racemase n=1 Tax=Glaciecola sp. MH2013 TaxID=2785524 RepID=UPI00189EF832|nr:alanine racemase [Glaciecola sp. MH2013]MBF7074013.1 alanine racemase [Glaciecola sp. MH2013]